LAEKADLFKISNLVDGKEILKVCITAERDRKRV